MSDVREPLRHRNFRLLAAARAIDYLGNGIALTALPFAVLDATGSVADLGIVLGARSVANIVVLLLGGVLADRLPRVVVLQGSALVAAASQAVVAASVLARFDSVVLLILLGAVNGAAAGMALPAMAALTPQTVPADLLRQANALVRMGIGAATIVGASAGGVLVAALGSGWGLAIDAVSFLGMAGCLVGLRVPTEPSDDHRTSTLRALGEGWREFISHTWVWVIVLQFLVCNAAVAGAIRVLGPAVAEHTAGITAWGLALAAQMLGAVIGALLAAHRQPRRALWWGTAVSTLQVLPVLALAHLPETIVLIVAMLLSGAAVEQINVAWEVSLQQNIPGDKLARVYSYDAFGSFLAIPVGQISAGQLAVGLGASPTLDIAAAVILSATLAVLAVPDIRRLKTRIEERV